MNSTQVETISKIVWFLLEPSNALMLLAIAGLVLSARPRWGRFGSWLVAGVVAVIAVAGWLPLGSLALRPLEQRFPAFVDDGKPVHGIIVLGGGVTPDVTQARGQIATNEAGERLTAMADLARRYPEARVVFSGGTGNFGGMGIAEADALEQVVSQLLPNRTVTYERMSRNTRENALLTRMIVRQRAGERWLLVTSAWHMPRAYAQFKSLGWRVTPYPVDFRTSMTGDDWKLSGSIAQGLRRVDIAAKEWIGLLAARLGGSTSSLLPGPDDAP